MSVSQFNIAAGLGGAAVLEAALRVRGVGVRPFPALPVGDCVRITVGPDALMQRLLAALDAVLGEVER